MKKSKIKSVLSLNWLLWLLLIILWNFLYPKATPIEDVVVSVVLSILFILIKKKN